MQITRQITVDEMVEEFLKAELHSSRFRAGSLKALAMLGLDEELIESPDFSNAQDNKNRQKVLGLCRGWPDTELFTDFPTDTTWFYATIPSDELATIYRLKSSDNMSDEERLLSSTVARVMAGRNVKNVDTAIINQICNKILSGQPIPPIILVSDELNGRKVLIEGHSRSIAYASLSKDKHEVAAILGLSPKMKHWRYF